MKRFLIALLMVLLLAACAGEEEAPAALDVALTESLESALTAGLPGVTLVAGLGAEAPAAVAGGLADLSSAEEMTPDHRMHIASVTKLFTTVAALRLFEQQRLDLDAALEEVLGGHALAQVAARLPHFQRMTVRHVLDHTAGTYPTNNDPEYIRAWLGSEAGAASQWTTEDFLRLAARSEPRDTPGQAYYYSDTNTILLGLAVESVTGETLRDHFRRVFFEPLELSSAAFFGDELAGRPTARGYLHPREEFEGFLDASKFARVEDSLWLDTTSAGERIDAASSIVLSARDLYSFADAVFRGELLGDAGRSVLVSFAEGLEKEDVGARRRSALVARHSPVGVLLTAEGDGPGGVHSLVAYQPATDLLVVALTNSFGLGPESDLLVGVAESCAARVQGL